MEFNGAGLFLEITCVVVFVSRSNFKNNPALCEQQLLLAANKDKEWGMFERWIILLLLLREQRVTPFPYLLR